jgi:hypothetical protein
MRIDGDTAIKKDIEKYFQLFWPQIEDDEKEVITKDLNKIVDGTFDRDIKSRDNLRWKKECKSI